MESFQTYLFKEGTIDYGGTELAPHWIYKRFSILGNALVAFTGKANVPIENMVDLEDRKNNAHIYSPKMLHFLGEFFTHSLEQGILLQFLLVNNVYETLLESGTPDLSRKGDDLFYDGRKLSVSIATSTPVSVLIHFGINVETDNTPIPTAGLKDMKLSPEAIATEVLERFSRDYNAILKSRVKVLPR
jgi:uncharacterized protein